MAMPTTQLRRYQLPTHRSEQEQWLTWWTEVRAMRERHGFHVVSAVLHPAAVAATRATDDHALHQTHVRAGGGLAA